MAVSRNDATMHRPLARCRSMIPRAGRDEGTEAEFTWARTTREVPAPELAPSGQVPRWHVYQIDVEVGWGGGQRTVGVTTLRNMAGYSGILSLRQQIEAGTTLGPQIFTTGPVLEGRASLTANNLPTSTIAITAQAPDQVPQVKFIETPDEAIAVHDALELEAAFGVAFEEER